MKYLGEDYKSVLIFTNTYNFKQMSRIINSILFLLIFCSGLLSCEKEFSAEEGGLLGGGGTTGGTAKFTLNGAPGDCSPLTMSGIYKAGVVLDQSNTILITANVTAIGDYTISTANINGVTFTDAGVFTSLGTQVITLTGSGIPAAAGSFNFNVGSAYCSFAVPFLAASGGTGAAIYTFNGGAGNCTSPVVGGTFTAGTALTASNTIQLGVNVTTAGSYSVTTNSVNGVTFTGSGTFTATGPANITLTSLDTPAAAGTFSYKPGSNGCAFSITYATGSGGGGAGSGSALFTFNGGTGNCASPAIGGTYTAGTALTASNTIVLGVNVTTPGTYSLTTDSANGVTFSGTGSFAAAGPATISLSSTNTGLAQGTFSYRPGTNGCAFSIAFQPAATGNGDFLKATLAGVAYQFNNTLTGTLDNATLPSSLQVGGNLSSPGTGADNLQILFYNSTGTISSGIFNPPSATNLVRAVAISYFDNSGAEWFLTSGTITLTLTSTTSATATFSGILSKLDSNQQPTAITKALTAGSFKITF